MCTVSMIGDHYSDRWTPPNRQVWPVTLAPVITVNPVTRDEFDALKAEVLEMKELLRAAKRIDELTGQEDCEMEEKLVILRKVAELVGVDLEDVLTQKETH
jgi:hypothetical protein